jgi:glucose-6-phosphate-specific signal transduction histidine kinase
MIKNILNKSLKFRIIFALLMTLVALALTFQLKSHIQDARFLILYPTIFFMAWATGLSPAIMAVILSTAAIHLQSEKPNFSENLRLTIYFITSIGIAWMIEYNRRRENRFQNHLEKSSNAMTSIIEGMKDSFVSVDRNWKIIAVNRNYECQPRRISWTKPLASFPGSRRQQLQVLD